MNCYDITVRESCTTVGVWWLLFKVLMCVSLLNRRRYLQHVQCDDRTLQVFPRGQDQGHVCCSSTGPLHIWTCTWPWIHTHTRARARTHAQAHTILNVLIKQTLRFSGCRLRPSKKSSNNQQEMFFITSNFVHKTLPSWQHEKSQAKGYAAISL